MRPPKFNLIALSRLFGLMGVILILGGFIIAQVKGEWRSAGTLALLIAGGGLLAAFVAVNFEWLKGVLIRRKTAVAANVLFMSILAMGLFIGANYISYKRYLRLDLTRAKIHGLSEKTKNILAGVDKPLQVVVFYPPYGRRFTDIRDLLKEYSYRSRNVQVEYIDPDRDPVRAEILAKKYNVNKANVVVFAYGERTKQVEDSDIFEYDYSRMYAGGPPSVAVFKGEEAFTSAIISVTQEKQTTVFFTTGHKERDPQDFKREGYSQIAAALKRDNIKVEKTSLLDKKEVPADCDLLVIAGPQPKFTEYEISLIKEYLEKDGRLLALIDPVLSKDGSSFEKTGLEELTLKWGVVLKDALIVDPGGILPLLSPLQFFSTNYGYHEISKPLEGEFTMYFLARPLETETKEGRPYFSTKIVETTDQAWGETDLRALSVERRSEYNAPADYKGPLAIAVAVSPRRIYGPDASEKGARLVIFGDSDFVSNALLNSSPTNQDLFLNAVHWLTEEKELVGIGPKQPENVKLSLTRREGRAVFWLVIAGLPGAGLLLGGAIWWRRRK